MPKKRQLVPELLVIDNPFEKLTAEELNDDYALIAYLFAKPQQSIFSQLMGRQNSIIVGGWGSGKTTLLKYLGFETQLEVLGDANIRDSNFIGTYVKIGRGSFRPFLKPGGDFKPGGEVLFGHYFNLFILERIISVLIYGAEKGVIDISEEQASKLHQSTISRFSEMKSKREIRYKTSVPLHAELHQLKSEVEGLRHEIETFLDTRDLEDNLSYEGRLSVYPTSIRTFLDETIKSIWSDCGICSRKRFYVLLDECEQFSKGQQRVINTIIKQRLTTLVFKLATRPPDIQTMETLDEGVGLTDRECKHVYLDKEYDAVSASFRQLCREVAQKRLEKYGYPVTDIKTILGRLEVEEEAGRDDIITYLKNMYPTRERVNDAEGFATVYKDFKIAAAYQILHDRGKRKKYSGFEVFVMLSSGIMAHFLELCRTTFRQSIGEDILLEPPGKITFKRIPLPEAVQDEAAVTVSGEFYSNIRGRAQSLKDTSIEMEFGEKIQYIVGVLGGIFRKKLMTFNEPEAAMVEIPEGLGALASNRENPVQQLFNTAIGISVFQEGTPYMPQHVGGVRPPTYVLNRILAPYLHISPRPRWRTRIRADVLNRILEVSEGEFASLVLERKRRDTEVEKKEPVHEAQLPLLPVSGARLSENMPVLSYIANKLQGRPFEGKTLLVLLHFLRDLVPFMESCRKLGASPGDTMVFHKNYQYPNKREVIEQLQHEGHGVYPVEESADRLEQITPLTTKNLIVVEDGGIIVPQLHERFESIGACTLGAVEQTTRGLRNDEHIGQILFPVLSVPGSRIKDTFEPPHVARALVSNLPNMLSEKNLAGRHVLVIGFGTIGEQVALHLRDTLKMIVSIFDSDSTRLVVARQHGFDTEETLVQGVGAKYLVVGATGETAVNRDAILAMSHNTHLVSASSEQWEFCVSELEALSSRKEGLPGSARDMGTRYVIRNTENYVNLLADGFPINFWHSESMPNEVSDLIMTLLLVSAVEVAISAELRSGIDRSTVDRLSEQWELASMYLQYHK